jgi:hypothetical protein
VKRLYKQNYKLLKKEIKEYRKWRFQEDPRWQLDGTSRQHEPHESKILLRCWGHTWQKKKKKTRRIKTDTTNPQPVQNSPHHITLRKQEGSHTARHWLQTCLGEADQQMSK